jgi:hypothetical protein
LKRPRATASVLIAMDQHVIGGERFAALAVAFDAARGDRICAPRATPSDRTQPAAAKAGSMRNM